MHSHCFMINNDDVEIYNTTNIDPVNVNPILGRYKKLTIVPLDEIKPGIYFRSTGNEKDPSEVRFFYIKKVKVLYIKTINAVENSNAYSNKVILAFLGYDGETRESDHHYSPILISNSNGKEEGYLISREDLEKNPFFMSVENINSSFN